MPVSGNVILNADSLICAVSFFQNNILPGNETNILFLPEIPILHHHHTKQLSKYFLTFS